ncbi:MAG: GPW/gp25 family protein [Pseudomonadota bacterium]
MTGLSINTGTGLAYSDHVDQSISDILTTPIGSRVMRRDYGSELPFLIDAPMNGETMVILYRATAEALARWEPRITLRRVQAVAAEAGHLTMELTTEEDGTERVRRLTIGGQA